MGFFDISLKNPFLGFSNNLPNVIGNQLYKTFKPGTGEGGTPGSMIDSIQNIHSPSGYNGYQYPSYDGEGDSAAGGSGDSSWDAYWKAQLKYFPESAAMATQLMQTEMPKQHQAELSNLNQFGGQYQDAISKLYASGRKNEIDSVANLAPSVTAAYKAGEDPMVSGMRNVLGTDIMNELNAGEKLSPRQIAAVQEASRSGEIARGGSTGGGGSVNRESVARTIEGMDLGSRRRAEASNFMAHEDARQPDPFSVVLGQASNMTSNALSRYDAGGQMPKTVAEPPTASGMASIDNQSSQINLMAQQYANQMAMLNQFMPELMG